MGDSYACLSAASKHARGMRDGATEALRQVRTRLKPLSTDSARREAGVIHRMWQWLWGRCTMEYDETGRRRHYSRLAIGIPGSKTFMPTIPALGDRYVTLSSAGMKRRRTFHKLMGHMTAMSRGVLNSMEVAHAGPFKLHLGGDAFHSSHSRWKLKKLKKLNSGLKSGLKSDLKLSFQT